LSLFSLCIGQSFISPDVSFDFIGHESLPLQQSIVHLPSLQQSIVHLPSLQQSIAHLPSLQQSALSQAAAELLSPDFIGQLSLQQSILHLPSLQQSAFAQQDAESLLIEVVVNE
jgi:hypothetical protein